MSEMQKILGVTDFVSEILKHVESYPDFEKLVHIIHHGLQLKITKENQLRQTILSSHIL